MKIRKSKFKITEVLFDYINIMFMCIICLMVIYPIWYIFVLSLNEGMDAGFGGIYFFPRKFTLENYAMVFKNEQVVTSFIVTISRTIIATILNVVTTSMLAFVLTKKYLIGRKLFLTICTITMYFSGGIIPSFLVMKNLGFVDNYLVLVIPGMVSFYNALIFMSFFRQLPDAIEESAKIDGANELLIYARIIMPMSLPVIAVISLFVGVYFWNEYFVGVIYIIRNTYLQPIQTFLYTIISTAQGSAEAIKYSTGAPDETTAYTSKSLKLATMFVTTAPIIIVYPFVQKYLVKGMMIGSVKG